MVLKAHTPIFDFVKSRNTFAVNLLGLFTAKEMVRNDVLTAAYGIPETSPVSSSLTSKDLINTRVRV